LFDFLTLPRHAPCACSVAAPAAARFEIEADRFVAAESSLYAWQGGLVAELSALQAAWSGLDGVLLAIWATWSAVFHPQRVGHHQKASGFSGPSRANVAISILENDLD
jgi:hypothetical protein